MITKSISDKISRITRMFPISMTRTACRGLVPCLNQAAPLHLSPNPAIQASSPVTFQATTSALGPSDRVTCTLIPGDGVGPEIMDSCQEVLQSMGAKIDFEEMYFSEVRKNEATFRFVILFQSVPTDNG